MAFTLSFELVCEQTKYIAHDRRSLYGGDLSIKTEFILEGNIAIQVGLHLEEMFEEDIWFDQVNEEGCHGV